MKTGFLFSAIASLLLFPCLGLAGAVPQVEETAGARQPQIFCDAKGDLHLVYSVQDKIVYRFSADGGQSFSPESLILQGQDSLVGMRRGPRVAASGNRVLATVVSGKNLLAFVSNDGGKSWSGSREINDAKDSAREGLGNVCALDGKGFFAAWLDLRNGATELWGAFSPDGVNWDRNVQIYKSRSGSICECCHPSVAYSGGHLAVMWRNHLAEARDMYAAESLDDGKTFSRAEKLGKGSWKLNACPMDGGSLALDEEGRPVAVWRREKQIYQSAPLSEELSLGEGAQAVAASAKGETAAVWQAGPFLMLKRASVGETETLGEGSYVSLAAHPQLPGIFAVWEGPGGGNLGFLRLR